MLTRDTPLAQAGLPGLSAETVRILEESQQVRTCGQLHDAVTGAGVQADPDGDLSLPSGTLQRVVRLLAERLPPGPFQADALARPRPLGAVLDDFDDFLQGTPVELGAEPLPAKVNLVAELPDILDQGMRPTCVAMAAAAIHGWRRMHVGDQEATGPQQIYFNCQEREPFPGGGARCSTAIQVLEEQGACREVTWPFNPTQVAGDEGQGPPPPGAVEEAHERRVSGALVVGGTDVRTLKAVLAGRASGTGGRGTPVLVGLPLFGSFFGAETARTGAVALPFPSEKPRGWHAMVLVGFCDQRSVFIVRNSWGESFGRDCPDGPGHCTVPYRYVARHGRSRCFALPAPERVHTRPRTVVRRSPSPQLVLGADHRGGPVGIRLPDLARHVTVIGTTGGGKTTLCKQLCAQAALQGVPVLAVDTQGDLASMTRVLSPEEAERQGLDSQERERLARCLDPVIYTPQSTAGRPLSANPLAQPAPRGELACLQQAEVCAALLVDQLEGLPRSRRRFFEAAITRLVLHARSRGSLSTLAELVALVRSEETPPLLEEILTASELTRLRRSLQVLLSSSTGRLLDQGEPLDIGSLLGHRTSPKGTTRLSVLYLNTIALQRERELFVGLLADAMYRWMRQQPARHDGRPRALIFIDEMAAFVPNPTHRKPACKDPLILLYKQARKYGVGILAASQSPGDFDYKALGQAGTLCVGRLRTEQELRKLSRLLSPKELAQVPDLRVGEFILSSMHDREGSQRFKGCLPLLGHGLLTESQLASMTRRSPAQQAPALAGARLPAPRTSHDQAVPGPRGAPSVSSASSPCSADPPLADALRASPRALTLGELAAAAEIGLAGARRALEGMPEVQALRRGTEVLYHLDEQGLRADWGFMDRVLTVLGPPVQAAAAERLGRRLLNLDSAFRRGGPMSVCEAGYPIWLMEGLLPRRGVLSSLGLRRSVLLAVDGLSGRVLQHADGQLSAQPGASLTDARSLPLKLASLELVRPKDLPLVTCNHRRWLSPDQVRGQLSGGGQLEIKSLQKTIWPYWICAKEPRQSKRGSLVLVDAVLGLHFRSATRPDLRSIRT